MLKRKEPAADAPHVGVKFLARLQLCTLALLSNDLSFYCYNQRMNQRSDEIKACNMLQCLNVAHSHGRLNH